MTGPFVIRCRECGNEETVRENDLKALGKFVCSGCIKVETVIKEFSVAFLTEEHNKSDINSIVTRLVTYNLTLLDGLKKLKKEYGQQDLQKDMTKFTKNCCKDFASEKTELISKMKAWCKVEIMNQRQNMQIRLESQFAYTKRHHAFLEENNITSLEMIRGLFPEIPEYVEPVKESPEYEEPQIKSQNPFGLVSPDERMNPLRLLPKWEDKRTKNPLIYATDKPNTDSISKKRKSFFSRRSAYEDTMD